MVEVVLSNLVKYAASLLFERGRSRVSEALRNSNTLAAQTFFKIIASDLDEIKSELDAAKRSHLIASIYYYNEGLKSISFDARDYTDAGPSSPRRSRLDDDGSSAGKDVEMFFTAPVNLSETTKKRFGDARMKATEVISNPSVNEKDLLLAYSIKVMAQLLELVDKEQVRGLWLCIDYLKDINSKEAFSKLFNQEIYHPSPILGMAPRQRRSIIWSVCHLNRMVFDIAQRVGNDEVLRELFPWPCIKIKGKKESVEIDPLRHPKLKKNLEEDGKKDCSVILWFGEKSEQGIQHICPCSIAANPQGEYLLVDEFKRSPLVLDSLGKYLKPLSKPTDSSTLDITSDEDGNVYLLTKQDRDQVDTEQSYKVFAFDSSGKQYHSFALKKGSKGRKLEVSQHSNKTKVLILEGEANCGLHARVEVYETDGTFVDHIGERILQYAQDIVSAKNGHIFVLDKWHESERKFIHEFDADRCHLRRYDVASDSVAIAFYPVSEHIIIISVSSQSPGSNQVRLSIKSQDADESNSDPVLNTLRTHTFEINGRVSDQHVHATVTTKGRIAIAIAKISDRGILQGEVIIY